MSDCFKGQAELCGYGEAWGMNVGFKLATLGKTSCGGGGAKRMRYMIVHVANMQCPPEHAPNEGLVAFWSIKHGHPLRPFAALDSESTLWSQQTLQRLRSPHHID